MAIWQTKYKENENTSLTIAQFYWYQYANNIFLKIGLDTLTKMTVWFEMPHKNHDCQSIATREHKCCTYTTKFRRKNTISLTFKKTTFTVYRQTTMRQITCDFYLLENLKRNDLSFSLTVKLSNLEHWT